MSPKLVARLASAVLLLGGLLSAYAVNPAPVLASFGDWAQFHNSPTHEGYNTQETILTASSVHTQGLAVNWTGNTGGSIFSSPAVAAGVVYVRSGTSDNGKLSAYQVGCASNGGACSPLWTGDIGATSGQTDGDIWSSPAVSKDTVYIGSNKLSAYAIGCNTGGGFCDPLWTQPTGYISSSPTVVGARVYVGSGDGKLYAFNAAGGALVWTATTGGEIVSSPAVANSVVYVGSGDGRLYAFNETGGALLWTATIGSEIVSSPAVANGRVYVGSSNGTLYAFDAGDGHSIWTHPTSGPILSSPAVANGVVYVGSSDSGGGLNAFDAVSGTQLWTGPATVNGIVSSPAVANGVVYVGTQDGTLCAFDATAGTQLWTGTVDGGSYIDSSPAVTHGVVYIGSSDGKLYAYGLNSMAETSTTAPASIAVSTTAPASIAVSTTAPASIAVSTTAPASIAVATPTPTPTDPGAQSDAGIWPQYRHDPTRQGLNAPETTLSTSSVMNLDVAWTSLTERPVYSSPAVVYVAHENGVVYVASDDGKLYAFKAVDGHMLWTAAIGPAATDPPTPSFNIGYHYHSSPAVAGGKVYVGSKDGRLYAFDAAGDTNCTQPTPTGPGVCTPLWTSTPTGPGIRSSPAVANGRVYVGSDNHKLYVFDAAGCGSASACEPLWTSTPTGGGILSSPAVVNGKVYVGSEDYKLYAFDAAGQGATCTTGSPGNPVTCGPLWTAATGNYLDLSSPAVANGVVYIGSYDAKLYAFKAATGALLWRAATGGPIYSTPTVANGKVYVGSNDGKLYAFAVGCATGGGTCTPLWTATTGGQVTSSPAVANGVVYVGSWDAKLYAFDAAGDTNCTPGAFASPAICTPLWTHATGAGVTSSPAVANGMVYVGSLDGKLYAFALAGVTSASPSVEPSEVVDQPGEWPQYHNDPANQGHNTVETTLSNDNVNSLVVAWTGSTEAAVESSPAVANGLVYVGSKDGRLYAFKSHCGSGGVSCSPVWTASTGGPIWSSPAVAGGVVYVGSEDGTMYAFNADDGHPVWTATTGGPIWSSPAVAHGVVYVGSDDGGMYALKASDGHVLWKAWIGAPFATTPSGTTDHNYSSPAVAHGVVYIGSLAAKLYAFDAAGVLGCSGGTCSPLWIGGTTKFIRSSPAVANGFVYIGAGYGLYAFKVGCAGGVLGAHCSPAWTGATDGDVDSTPAVANDRVFVGSNDGFLYAFDAAGVANCSSGHCTPYWKGKIDGGAGRSSPAVANGVVYIGSAGGSPHAFKVDCANDGSLCPAAWIGATTGDTITSSPAVADGAVFIGSDNGKLYAFRLPGSEMPFPIPIIIGLGVLILGALAGAGLFLLRPGGPIRPIGAPAGSAASAMSAGPSGGGVTPDPGGGGGSPAELEADSSGPGGGGYAESLSNVDE